MTYLTSIIDDFGEATRRITQKVRQRRRVSFDSGAVIASIPT